LMKMWRATSGGEGELRAESAEPCGDMRQRREEEGAVPVLPHEALSEIVRQAEAGYPEEICGMVIGRPDAPHTYRVRQVANIANREPQEDSGGLARDARTAYKMDPLEQLRVLRESDEQGWEVCLFYHSHPDHDAYFSRMDRERALTPEGEPVWPGAGYLVVSVIGGRARGAAWCRWDLEHRGFLERAIELPASRADRRDE
jgi:proteasome lid subunit RPN8/RPN11